MAFIRIQKAVRDGAGRVVGGSASVIDVIYVSDAKHHSKQKIRERLGSVISLESSGRRGIFRSPTRGLVEYDADSDTFTELSAADERLKNHQESALQPSAHTVFGDAYMLLSLLKKSGLLSVFREAFPKQAAYQRLLAHILHGILGNGAKITCDNFMRKSFASYLLPEVSIQSLKEDDGFFKLLGEFSSRQNFFTCFARAMRRNIPGSGQGCYVDSASVPGDIIDDPLSAPGCVRGAWPAVPRLALVLDKLTLMPVWFEFVPAKVADLNSLRTVFDRVSGALGINIADAILDSDYVSAELLEKQKRSLIREMIVRMPFTKDFPYRELYEKHQAFIYKGKYSLLCGRQFYSGKRVKAEIFGRNINAYLYVNQNKALSGYKNYLEAFADEVAAMTDSEKDWLSVRYGYFVLLSNRTCTPEELLSHYLEMTETEIAFKNAEDYLDLLPLCAWSRETLRGKLLYDAILTIVTMTLRRQMAANKTSLSDLIGISQSLMCCLNKNGQILVDTPSPQVRECYAALGLTVPAAVSLEEFKVELGLAAG